MSKGVEYNDKGKFESSELSVLERAVANFYIGDFFDALIRQIEYRVNVGDARNAFTMKMFFHNVRESNQRSKKDLMDFFKVRLVDAIAREVQHASEDWDSAFVRVPPKPDTKDERNVEQILKYLTEASEAFLEYVREVGTTEKLGGEPWAKIADMTKRLWEGGDNVSYDDVVRVVGLEHNTGRVFGRKIQNLLDIRHKRLPLKDLIEEMCDAIGDEKIKRDWLDRYFRFLHMVQNTPPEWRESILPLFNRSYLDAEKNLALYDKKGA